jgi:hypothetical protein
MMDHGASMSKPHSPSPVTSGRPNSVMHLGQVAEHAGRVKTATEALLSAEELFATLTHVFADQASGKITQADFQESLGVAQKSLEQLLPHKGIWIDSTGLANSFYWNLVSLVYAANGLNDVSKGLPRGLVWA